MKKIVLPLSNINKFNDIVISSGISIVRNIDGLMFSHKLTQDQKSKITDQLKNVLIQEHPNDLLIVDFKNYEYSLQNQYLSNLVIASKYRENLDSIIAKTDGSWILLPNTKEHLKIYSIIYGQALKHIYHQLSSVLSKLDSQIHFAYNPKFGFSSSDIHLSGSGMSLSLLVNLTGLELQGDLATLTKTAEETGYSLIPFLTDKNSGLFLLKNISSFGINELDQINHMISFIEKLQVAELLSRNQLMEDKENLELFILQVQNYLLQDDISYSDMVQLIAIVDFLDKKLYKINDRQRWIEQIFRLTNLSDIFTDVSDITINQQRVKLIKNTFHQLVNLK